MIFKYRKKPVVIEALQFTEKTTYDELDQFITCDKEIYCFPHSRTPHQVTINTLEGDTFATYGDYIVKGIENEFYPCKSSIFENSHEMVQPVEQVKCGQ